MYLSGSIDSCLPSFYFRVFLKVFSSVLSTKFRIGDIFDSATRSVDISISLSRFPFSRSYFDRFRVGNLVLRHGYGGYDC